MLFAGLIYGWSVFRAAMVPDFPGWSVSAFSLNFSLCMSFFCVGTLCCGVVSKKLSTRAVIIVSAVLIFVGFFITSRTTTPLMLYVGYGVLSGFAIGAVYNSVMSTTLKWFPDCSGLMSGILLMGFGFSAILVGPVFTRISAAQGWREAFIFLGSATAVIFLAGACILRPPPKEYICSGPGKTREITAGVEELGPGGMLKTGRFWAYFVWAIVLSAGGLAINAHSYDMAYDVLMSDRALSATAHAVTGKLPVLVALFSVFNGLGRVIFGAFFDKIGRKKTMNLVCLVFAVSTLVLLAALWKKIFIMLMVGLICCGFCYGGIMPSNSSFIRGSFGEKHYSVNFSIVTLNLLPASYIGPMVSGVLFDATGSYMGNVLCLGIFTVIGIICSIVVSKSKKLRAKQTPLH